MTQETQESIVLVIGAMLIVTASTLEWHLIGALLSIGLILFVWILVKKSIAAISGNRGFMQPHSMGHYEYRR